MPLPTPWRGASKLYGQRRAAQCRRIALKNFSPQGFRAEGIVPFRPPSELFWGLGVLAALGLLAWGARRGAFVLVLRRPGYAGVAGVLTLALAFPPVSWAGGGGGGPSFYWELSDPLGTSLVLLDENGARVRHTLFTPFGSPYASVGSMQGLRKYYAGHRRHEGLNLSYMKARWYDPDSGTFLSIDPLVGDAADPQSHNAYSYARNNPANYVDPTGELFDECGLGCRQVIQYEVFGWDANGNYISEPISSEGVAMLMSASNADSGASVTFLGVDMFGLGHLGTGLPGAGLAGVSGVGPQVRDLPTDANGNTIQVDPEQEEFERALGVAGTKASHTRDQFHGEAAGSFVLKRRMTLWERLTSKFTQIGRFLVTRGNLLTAVGLDGTPMAGMKGIPRGAVALVIAPSPNLHNVHIESFARAYVDQAKFLGVPVYIVGRQGAMFQAGIDGSFGRIR